MRSAVAIFFVLCAIFLFILSLHAELVNEGLSHHQRAPPGTRVHFRQRGA